MRRPHQTSDRRRAWQRIRNLTRIFGDSDGDDPSVVGTAPTLRAIRPARCRTESPAQNIWLVRLTIRENAGDVPSGRAPDLLDGLYRFLYCVQMKLDVPSSRISETEPRRKAMTGVPHAMASIDEAKSLWPVNREKQCGCLAKEAGLISFADLAQEFHV
jgi:hypothetical protein